MIQTLGTLVSLLGILVGHGNTVYRERQTIAALDRPGASILRQFEVEVTVPGRPEVPRGHPLIRAVFGDDVFERVDTIDLLPLSCKCHDRDLVHIGKCSQLYVLFLSGPGISDAGVEAVAKIKTISTLGLSHTKITDKSLSLLRKLNLVYLNIEGTSVSAKAVAEFQHHEPQCTVEWDGWHGLPIE